MKPNDGSDIGIFRLKATNGLVEHHNFFRILLRSEIDQSEGQALSGASIAITSAFYARTGTSVFDQNSTHRFSTGGVEMGATLPCDLFRADEPQICLVYQRCRGKRVVASLLVHALLCDLAQLGVDKVKKFSVGLSRDRGGIVEQSRDRRVRLHTCSVPKPTSARDQSGKSARLRQAGA